MQQATTFGPLIGFYPPYGTSKMDVSRSNLKINFIL